ncbi:hypothetical protein [Nocardioides sp.]|uniref:hypothetical protein n=1 Tax=Nocardioides sp. TaxID=35761 RepID=UPI002B278EC9|nr:hypothetical protein [Nocardioides sp.]
MTRGSEGLEALLSTAGTLWPGARIERAGEPGKSAGATFALVPHGRRPQLLVPLAPARAAPAALCRFSAASSRRDVLTRLAAAGLTRATGGAVLRDRVVIHVDEPGHSLQDHLGDVLGEPVTFSLGVGPERVNRKPVLQVYDRRGRTVAFVKVGDSEQARDDVRAEAVALRRLASADLDPLVVPRLVGESTWNGLVLVVMSPVRAGASVRRSACGPAPLSEMGRLSGAFAEPSGALGALGWWERQRAAVDRVVDPGLAAPLRRAVERIDTRDASTSVAVGAWHGDWTPWNMARAGSRLLLWDWERFETGVPRGLDAWHYRVNCATRRRGLRADVVLGELPEAGADRGPGGLLARLYLLAVATRYAGLVDAARGSDIAPAAAVMATALDLSASSARDCDERCR